MNGTRDRLHIGCGPQALAGWVNIDNQSMYGADRVLDVTLGLPFENVEFVFAEHFIEHLSFDDALNFLRECRRVLAQNGVLRLSTPNLDWVFLTHYAVDPSRPDADRLHDCFILNRAFRGWGHQFLYNMATLTRLLRKAGFANVEACRYGESRHETLRGLERHETWDDTPEHPHVLVVEAWGVMSASDADFDREAGEFRAAVDVV